MCARGQVVCVLYIGRLTGIEVDAHHYHFFACFATSSFVLKVGQELGVEDRVT